MTKTCLAKRSFTRGEMEHFRTRHVGRRKADAMYRILVDPSTPAFRFAQSPPWVVIKSNAMRSFWRRPTNYSRWPKTIALVGMQFLPGFPALLRQQGRLNPVVHVQFVQDIRHIMLHR